MDPHGGTDTPSRAGSWRDQAACRRHSDAMPPPGDRPSRRRRLRRARGRPGRGPLRRATEGRLAGGVAAGLADRTGIDVTLVRMAFVVTAIGSGFGVAAYVLAWLLVPTAGEQHNIASRAAADRRGLALAAGLASVLVAVSLMAAALQSGLLGSMSWPLIISVSGLTLVWRNAPPEEQAVLRRLSEPLVGLTGEAGRTQVRLRLALAAGLLAAGLGFLLAGHPGAAVLRALGGVALLLAAIVLALGPWWLRIARDLVVERQARARAEERADMAARVHDSVLQTLALIQRRADNPQQVVQLARAQERELRSWLFGGPPPGGAGQAATLAAGVRAIQQEVEAQHGITVEAVTVGDCDLDDGLRSLLAAAREATVNAAKWSGAPSVAVFAEVEPEQVSVFVRDRGQGFDPAAVPGDRKGLSESIRGRMTRHGGAATVRSAPGEGAEVSLTMPRSAKNREASRA